jgi:hypothetical protein
MRWWGLTLSEGNGRMWFVSGGPSAATKPNPLNGKSRKPLAGTDLLNPLPRQILLHVRLY